MPKLMPMQSLKLCIEAVNRIQDQQFLLSKKNPARGRVEVFSCCYPWRLLAYRRAVGFEAGHHDRQVVFE